MLSYFKKYENDSHFYVKHLKGRMPKVIIDAHVHMNLPEHVANVSEHIIKNDWALECGFLMANEDLKYYTAQLFPDTDYRTIAFPWPLREADIIANNEYLSRLVSQGDLNALMCIRPEWNAEYCERILLEGGFIGFKPYPYMASDTKGTEISIFDFVKREHLKILDKHKKALILHLPRRGRLPDDDNIREIKDIVNSYPDIHLIIAHFGRCFTIKHFLEGIRKLGEDKNAIYFDTSAVLNPEIYEAALESLDWTRILFGSDMPILLWHGKRKWTETEYINLCREDFSWNKHIEERKKEDHYTFFLYEQINNILNALQKKGAGDKEKQGLFSDNALKAFRIEV